MQVSGTGRSKNGKIRKPRKEAKTGEKHEADKVGAILDSAKDIRKRKESPSGKAHDSQEELEKDEAKGIIKMADYKMTDERKYTIPLRQEWLKVPIYKRTKKAIRAIKEFSQKHMKTEEVKIGKHLNQLIWERGMKKPPHKVEVIIKKFEDKEDKYVSVELANAPKEEAQPEAKKGKISEKVKDILKAPEDKESVKKKDDIKQEEKLMEKEQQEKEERARAPKENHMNKPRKDVKQHIISHTGKSKDGVETTGK